MLIATFLATSLGAASPTILPTNCRQPLRVPAQAQAPLGYRQLGELPPGVGFKAVLKSVDGCPVSVLLQRGPDGELLEVPQAAPRVQRAPAGGPPHRRR